jgi:hypothetical protein
LTNTGSGCASEVVLEGIALAEGSACLQPGAFINAIHAAPALAAVRNLRRVNLLPIRNLSPYQESFSNICLADPAISILLHRLAMNLR